MTPFRSPQRFNTIGADATSLPAQAALTGRVYVPSIGYAAAVSNLLLFSDDQLEGYHLTPSNMAIETGCPIIYPRYLFLVINPRTAAAEAGILAAAAAQYEPLRQIGCRVLIWRTGNFTSGLPFLDTSYSGGELYVAQLWQSKDFFDPSVSAPPEVYSETANYNVSWYTAPPAAVTPEPPTPDLNQAGATLLEGPLTSNFTQGPYSPFPLNFTQHYKTGTALRQLDSAISARIDAVWQHAPNFKKFRVCDYHDGRPITRVKIVPNNEDPTTPPDGYHNEYLTFTTTRTSIYQTANPGPYTASAATSNYEDDPATAVSQIYADAQAFFS